MDTKHVAGTQNEEIYLHRKKRYLHHRLTKTVKLVDAAYDYMKNVAEEGGVALFVGTKTSSEAIKEEAIRSGQYYVNHRWLGGTLTNWETIQKRVARLKQINKMEEDGTFDVLPKKKSLV